MNKLKSDEGSSVDVADVVIFHVFLNKCEEVSSDLQINCLTLDHHHNPMIINRNCF